MIFNNNKREHIGLRYEQTHINTTIGVIFKCQYSFEQRQKTKRVSTSRLEKAIRRWKIEHGQEQHLQQIYRSSAKCASQFKFYYDYYYY